MSIQQFNKAKPMLCKLADKPFSDPEFIFENKWDGERILIYVSKDKIELKTRNENKISEKYPELINGLKEAFRGQEAIMDGEIVTFDEKGISSFQKLQNRVGLTKKEDIEIAEKEIPVVLYLFDILYLNGANVGKKSLLERKEILKKVIKENKTIKLTPNEKEKGKEFFKDAQQKGEEGVIAKRIDSQYLENKRMDSWQKIKIVHGQEAVICGYIAGTGSRQSTFGSLILGLYIKESELVYVGKVGTGFTAKVLKELFSKLKSLKTEKSPFGLNAHQRVAGKNPPKLGEEIFWIKPNLVAQIGFQQWTKDKKMRMPRFLGLRDDKKPRECIFEK